MGPRSAIAFTGVRGPLPSRVVVDRAGTVRVRDGVRAEDVERCRAHVRGSRSSSGAARATSERRRAGSPSSRARRSPPPLACPRRTRAHGAPLATLPGRRRRDARRATSAPSARVAPAPHRAPPPPGNRGPPPRHANWGYGGSTVALSTPVGFRRAAEARNGGSDLPRANTTSVNADSLKPGDGTIDIDSSTSYARSAAATAAPVTE